MTSLATMLEISRTFAFREAVMRTLKAAFPEVEVKVLPGRLQIEDLDKVDMFNAPSMLMAVSRIRPAEARMSGLRDVPVEALIWILAESRNVAGRLVFRDEIGLALCDSFLALLETPASRWGLDDIGMPENAEARPVITTGTESRDTAWFLASWHQTLYGQGQPFMDMETPLAADVTGRVLLPGDPGWTPPGTEDGL